MNKAYILVCSALLSITIGCTNKMKETKEEIAATYTNEEATPNDTLANSIHDNTSINITTSTPANVILTGIANEKLIPIYSKFKVGTVGAVAAVRKYSSYDVSEYDNTTNEYEHFMPGLDVLYGYKLLNIAHYNLKENKLSYFFKTSALIKTLYYPATIQDSIGKQPINRNYYLVSAYDQDTNKDSLINKKDLRHFYCIEANNSIKTLLVPKGYSVKKSQYDFKDDLMYLYATHDSNNNGSVEENEPTHIFYINLKQPTLAVKVY